MFSLPLSLDKELVQIKNHFNFFEMPPAVIIEGLTEPAVMPDWRPKVAVLVQNCGIVIFVSGFCFHLLGKEKQIWQKKVRVETLEV